MKRKSLLFALLVALFMPWAANAQESIPYTEGFESMSSASDLTAAGWISYQTNSGSFLAIETNASNVHSGSQALNIDSWNAGSTSDFVVVGLPLVDAAINTLQITFSYKVSTGNVYVGYLTDANDASTFVSLESYIASSSYTTVTKELNEAPATAARIAIKYLNWYRCYVDDIEVKALPTCVKPTLGQAQYITEEGASFQWTENGSATNWVLEYSTDQNFTNATSINRSGIPSYAITGLTAGTTYYVRVKSDCGGGDTSDWSDVVSFTTLCEPINAEGYSENFDSYTGTTSGSTNNLPDCWNRINTTSYSYYSGYPNVYSSNASSSPNCLRFYSYYSSYSDYDPQPQYAILPPMNGMAGMQVTLKARGYNATSTFKIGTMSDPSDASSFTMIAEQTGLTTSYQEFEYIIPANCHDKCLAIMIEAATTSTAIGVYIDDIVIATPPTCIKPSDLEVTATTTTTATLSWTNGAEGQTAWQICLNGDETNLIDANSNPFTIEEGLSAASTYTAKVRANCGNGDYSDWSNTVTFNTQCDVITITESWSENFNSLTAGIPNCWDNSEGTTSTESYKWNYYASGHDGAGLRFNSYSNSSGNTNFLKTPTLNFATGKVMQLSFWYKNPTGGDFSVYISTDGGDTYTTELATGLTSVSSWTQQEITLTNYVDAENVVIVFKGTSNYGNGDAYIYLDDVAIVEAPTCLKPTGLAVTANSITNDGATITWTAGGDETNWQIEFATDADFTNPLYETVEGEPTYTFHGLDDLTTYYVHVQAVCGGSDGSSEYCAPVSFTTLQTAANLPYSNDFESENGWVFVNGNLTNAWAYGEATNNGGTHALYISNDGGTNNAYSNGSAAMVYATKLFNFEAGTYVFSYDWKANGESNYDYLRVALVPSSVILTAGTSAPSVPSGYFYNNLPTGWIALDGGGKLNLKSDWQSFVSTEIEIATAGSYMMVFAWTDDTSSGTNPPAAIDNVSIEMVTCSAPTDLTVNESATTATSVELSWTENGEATAWQIELTDEEDNVEIIDANSNPFTLRDLTSESMYAARVRAYCDEDNQSRWSEEVIFETAADCQTSDGLAAVATTNSAAISWNGYGQEEFNLRYSTDGTTWTTESRVANPYTLASLTPATTYQVQVQPTCADAETWSATYTFHTLCESIVVTDTWSEGFEDGVLSFCWDQDGDGTWTVGTGDGNTYTAIGAHTGTYNAKITHNTDGNVTKLITPVLDLTSLNNPMLTFWYINRKWSSDIDGFAVYYRTASDAEWTQIYATEEAHETWTETSYVLPNPSATYQIAFEMTDGYGYGVGIDDVTIEDAPTYTLTIEGVGEENWEGGKSGYYLIASPVTVDPANAIDSYTQQSMIDGDYDLYAFDQAEEDEWRNYKQNAFSLEPGKGYLYAHKTGGEFTLTGTAYSGNGEIELVYDDNAIDFKGWNLVGNPWGVKAYPDHAFYTMAEGGAGIDVTPNDANTEVAPMTGIFVVANGADQTVTFATENPNSKNAKLALNLTNSNKLVDRAIVRFGEGQMLPKFQLNPNHTKVYFQQEGKDYAIVNATEMGEMPVSFKAESNGSYTLSVNAEEVSFAYLHLIDNMTGVETDLLSAPSYSFEAKSTDYANRFKLVFATGNNNGEDFAFFSNGSFVINNEGNATLQVVDVTGRILKSESINGCASVNVNAAPGVYMLRLVNGENVKVQKVVVR